MYVNMQVTCLLICKFMMTHYASLWVNMQVYYASEYVSYVTYYMQVMWHVMQVHMQVMCLLICKMAPLKHVHSYASWHLLYVLYHERNYVGTMG